MSDTPETDLWLKQQIVCNYEHEMVSAGFARTLERERDEAREALREIAAADWKTSGELRGMARRVLEAAK